VFGRLSLELGLPPVAYVGDIVGDNGDQAGGFDFSTDRSKAPSTRAEADEALRPAKGRRVLDTGAGYWVRPDLVECSPYAYFGGPYGGEMEPEPPPPPCPAK
jgi:hypothetical protein